MMQDWHVLYTAYCEAIIAGVIGGFTAEEEADAEKWRKLRDGEDEMVASVWRNEPSLQRITRKARR